MCEHIIFYSLRPQTDILLPAYPAYPEQGKMGVFCRSHPSTFQVIYSRYELKSHTGTREPGIFCARNPKLNYPSNLISFRINLVDFMFYCEQSNPKSCLKLIADIFFSELIFLLLMPPGCGPSSPQRPQQQQPAPAPEPEAPAPAPDMSSFMEGVAEAPVQCLLFHFWECSLVKSKQSYFFLPCQSIALSTI